MFSRRIFSSLLSILKILARFENRSKKQKKRTVFSFVSEILTELDFVRDFMVTVFGVAHLDNMNNTRHVANV